MTDKVCDQDKQIALQTIVSWDVDNVDKDETRILDINAQALEAMLGRRNYDGLVALAEYCADRICALIGRKDPSADDDFDVTKVRLAYQTRADARYSHIAIGTVGRFIARSETSYSDLFASCLLWRVTGTTGEVACALLDLAAALRDEKCEVDLED